MNRAIKPPFAEETARAKVQAAEDAWNSRDPERVALAYTEDSQWRNRSWRQNLRSMSGTQGKY